jgi:transcription elongation factor GreA
MALQYMTQDGYDKLKNELAEAIAQRPVISAAIAEARDKGDLSENAEYEAAREAQGLLELNISKLQNLVANARVIDESQIGTEKVQMLNKVKVKNLNTNQIMTFTLVGENEADFMAGKLAAQTPIGQALMGHKVGEVVEAKVPAGIIKFEILDITL